MMPQRLAAAAAGLVLPVVAVAFIAHAQGPVQASDRALPPAPCHQMPACAADIGTGFAIGDIALPGRLHVVTRPGAYGLSNPPQGDRYAVLDGQLVRIDGQSGKILSVLRPVDRILD